MGTDTKEVTERTPDLGGLRHLNGHPLLNGHPPLPRLWTAGASEGTQRSQSEAADTKWLLTEAGLVHD